MRILRQSVLGDQFPDLESMLDSCKQALYSRMRIGKCLAVGPFLISTRITHEGFTETTVSVHAEDYDDRGH